MFYLVVILHSNQSSTRARHNRIPSVFNRGVSILTSGPTSPRIHGVYSGYGCLNTDFSSVRFRYFYRGVFNQALVYRMDIP